MSDPLRTKHVGKHPDAYQVGDQDHQKSRDLRYGTNPLQTAALYNPRSFLGSLRELKTGKQGPSQTNMEDILYAAISLGYFDTPSAIIMKHENPCGFATQYKPEPLARTYRKARDADFRAAFGGVVLLNRPVDHDTSEAIRELFTEVLVAPDYDDGVVGRFKGDIRVFAYDERKFCEIPRYIWDLAEPEIRRLPDGSIIVSDVFLSPIRDADNLKQYVASQRQPTKRELRDLLTGYRLRVRSNSIRMVKRGYTTGIGIGQQDRVGCIEIATSRNQRLRDLAKVRGMKRAVDYSMQGSVMVSDGFFSETDSIELAHQLGITAILAPHGGRNFDQVLEKTDEYKMAFVDLPGEMRFFDHH